MRFRNSTKRFYRIIGLTCSPSLADRQVRRMRKPNRWPTGRRRQRGMVTRNRCKTEPGAVHRHWERHFAMASGRIMATISSLPTSIKSDISLDNTRRDPRHEKGRRSRSCGAILTGSADPAAGSRQADRNHAGLHAADRQRREVASGRAEKTPSWQSARSSRQKPWTRCVELLRTGNCTRCSKSPRWPDWSAWRSASASPDGNKRARGSASQSAGGCGPDGHCAAREVLANAPD